MPTKNLTVAQNKRKYIYYVYKIILIARIVDGTANAPRHLLYVILIFCRGTENYLIWG